MDAVTVKKFQFPGRGRGPGFDELVVTGIHTEFTPGTQHLEREGIEKLVGDNDSRGIEGYLKTTVSGSERRFAGG
jgi:hypothetical protein